ncbi:TMEM43 family protein [Magnetospirillum gryphiswaldense]|uniref:Protein containing DUF1625 n=1 Tax=Magnetospirillum gryphiswaldense TaxID=55518 RepID=A4TVG3_9PROT|nr:TMEM43 family protein [Magnetospirillum gryphiswaldense]AVM74016.1 hypothetical protein MSR1_15240 [Magnetospirillum gryphiswaldense MSR-1]AVM77919.1 hypothetical protein MSR1L_15240 [Magnetospirillum gryphiswaldense]CAM74620.1 protein containing DUF1625 [Magnetospirillum gryphiswaldense MSR-1]
MADDDSFTVTQHRNWFSRMGDSIAGVIVGLLLFAVSFVVLFWNESRAVDAITALDLGAKTVVSVSADRVDPANQGRLIHLSGPVTVPAALEDKQFRVSAANALRLSRQVEMYQWVETEEQKTEKSVGGGETTTTTYRYSRQWREGAVESSRFKRPEGHHNPAMHHTSRRIDVQGAKIGAFTLDHSQITQLDAFEPLPVTGDTPAPQGFRWVGEQLYRGTSPQDPQVGDLRVSFSMVPATSLSVVAAQSGSTLAEYTTTQGYGINLSAIGTHTAAAMFTQAKRDEATLTWILRGAGFLLMLFGLMLMSSPLHWLASLLPLLESLVSAATFVMALAVAIPLTLVTIALAWLTYRPLLAGGLILGGLAAAFIIKRMTGTSGSTNLERK